MGRSQGSQGGIRAFHGGGDAGSGHGDLRRRSQSGHPSREDGLFGLRPSRRGGPDLSGSGRFGRGGHAEYGWKEAPWSKGHPLLGVRAPQIGSHHGKHEKRPKGLTPSLNF